MLLVAFWPLLTGAQLSESDQAFLTQLRGRLELSASQDSSINALFTASQHRVDSLDLAIRKIQQSDDESFILEQLPILRQQKKDVRELRDLSIFDLLNPVQQNIFQQEIRPQKPAVLHFGIQHDRMSCTICAP